MDGLRFSTILNNSNILGYDITVGDVDEITYCKLYFKNDKEEIIVTNEELELLEKTNKDWYNLSLEEFKSLLFLVRL